MTAPTQATVEDAFQASGGTGNVVQIKGSELRTLLRTAVDTVNAAVARCVVAADAAPVDAIVSTLVLDSAAANSDLTFTAVTKGDLGISVILHNTGLTNTASIAVDGNAITVTLATTAGVSTSTANAVKALVDGDAAAHALATVAVEGTGLGLVDAFEEAQPFVDGVDGTPGTKNDIIAFGGQPYFCTADATTATSGAWKKLSLASL